MSQRRTPPTFVYRYVVVESDNPGVEVGAVLADARRDLVKTWEFFNFDTGEHTYVTGERKERLCSECYATSKLANERGHDWPCGVLETVAAS